MTGNLAKERISNAGYTLADVAKSLNISPQTLESRLRANDLKLEFLRELSKAIKKNLYYFLEDEDLPAFQNQKNYAKATDKKMDEQEIPLYNIEASAGIIPLYKDNSSDFILDYIRIPNLPKCDGAVYIKGDSMYPLLKSGDIVFFKRITDFENDIFPGEMYLVSLDIDGDEFVTAKFVQKSEKGDKWIKLVSQNQHHQPKDVHLKKVQAMAIIKASVRMNAIQ